MNENPNLFPPTPPNSPKEKLLALMKKPWFVIAFAVAVVMLVLGLSINRVMSALLHSRPEVVVPKLEGKSLTEALQIASQLELSLQQESIDFDESLPAGTVIRQHPPSGMQVRAGRAIRVIVSKGGQVVFIPDIIGRPIAEAQSMLAGDGMQMGAVSELYSNDTAKGTVMSQYPSSGTVATRGALVDVSVSKGMAPAGLPLLPDFIGQASNSVQEWAQGVGAQVRIKENARAVGPAGTVVKQDPDPGQPLLEGREIQITVVPLSSNQSSRFTFDVPKGKGEFVVRIMARDSTGESKIYEGKHTGGAKVEVPIGIESTTRFRVYVDDLLSEERVIEP